MKFNPKKIFFIFFIILSLLSVVYIFSSRPYSISPLPSSDIDLEVVNVFPSENSPLSFPTLAIEITFNKIVPSTDFQVQITPKVDFSLKPNYNDSKSINIIPSTPWEIGKTYTLTISNSKNQKIHQTNITFTESIPWLDSDELPSGGI